MILIWENRNIFESFNLSFQIPVIPKAIVKIGTKSSELSKFFDKVESKLIAVGVLLSVSDVLDTIGLGTVSKYIGYIGLGLIVIAAFLTFWKGRQK